MNKIEDIGIYTNIYQTEQRKHGHILYHAKCKVCGMEVYKPLKEIRECHTQCRHGENNGEYARTVYGRGYNSLSKDIPRDEFYKRVYEKWRHMIYGLRYTVNYILNAVIIQKFFNFIEDMTIQCLLSEVKVLINFLIK